jgi:hypothetical protein
MPLGKVIYFQKNLDTEVKVAIIIKEEYDHEGVWGHIACELDHSPDEEEIRVASVDRNVIIPFPKNEEIDKNLKYYKEAKHFLDRLVDFDTMSKDEIIAVCDMTAIIARQEL